MRTVEIGSERYTKVICKDEPGTGGACHDYVVVNANEDTQNADPCATVKFQDGPLKEGPVNGCHHEDLIAIILDRLQHFQAGEYACRENALAITKLEEALHWLNHRTASRQKRGVEGTHQA